MIVTDNKVKVLLPFDIVFDMDHALLMAINFKFHDERYFNFRFFKMSENDMHYLLINRKDKNPLYLITKDSLSKENVESLYVEFMVSDMYKYIVEIANGTGLFDMIVASRHYIDTSMEFNILCRNQTEVDKVKNSALKGKCNVILNNENFNINNYNNIYFNDIYDIEEYKTDLIGKCIYIANCRYNKEVLGDDIVGIKLDIILDLIDKCIINTIDLYSFPKDYNVE